MSDFGDYLGEMDRNRTIDVEIENLFTGSPNPDGELEPLTGLFVALRTGLDSELDDDAIGRIVAIASAAATTTSVPAAGSARRRSRSLLTSLRHRAAAVTVAATVILGGTSGLAVAADGAIPGDSLYGFDRAFEAVGIGAGGEQERLGEAEALIDAGEFIQGLQHAAEALEDPEATGSAATTALMAAADRVRAAGAEPSAVTRDQVAGLLTYLSQNVGDIDGQHVAELAVQIGRPENHPNGSPLPDQPSTEGPPADSPADPPGLTDGVPGPPDHVPANPPGQDKDKKEPGPPDGVPADPPGQNNNKNEPGPPDSKPNPPNNKP